MPAVPIEPLSTSILASMYFGDVVFAISGGFRPSFSTSARGRRESSSGSVRRKTIQTKNRMERGNRNDNEN
jgi:hypothetical protein